MLTAAFLAFFWQYSVDPVRGADFGRFSNEAQVAAIERANADRTSRRHEEFERRFNELTAALSEFAGAYNNSPRKVWPYKKAEELRKAIKALEHTEAWNDKK
jgi:hypothetical protein